MRESGSGSGEDYRKFFEPLFCYSRDIMFVDRYLDPSESNYAEFAALLPFLHRKKSHCQVSIHRIAEKAEMSADPRGSACCRLQR
jgi:hypothetical protein